MLDNAMIMNLFARVSKSAATLAHDPEKREPVFG
jgi:hypothetical protein